MKASIGIGLAAIAFAATGCNPKPAPSPTEDTKKPVNKDSRVSVKHALDPEARSIDLTPTKITLGELDRVKAPADFSKDSATRVGPFEKKVWQVQAELKSVVLRKDGDYYVVLGDDKGGESVVEVPDPKLCEGSPLHDQIAAAREMLEKRYHPTETAKDINEKATVQGVGFFGTKRKTGAVSPRLMPGLKFEFKG